MRKFTMVIVLVVLAAVVLTGCTSVDVVAKDALRSFKDVLVMLPAQEESTTEWYVEAPDGGAQFHWTGAIVQVKVAAQPFIDAGLDVALLDNADEEWIYFAQDFVMEPKSMSGAAAQFEYIISVGRSALGYHTAMDHYNIALGGGNMFEWAKDMQVNGASKQNQDKDVVFVLNPEPLIAAGVDAEKVEGWAYATVSVEENGKPVDVWKFLKPIDLK
ncbi:hypothetical protein AGMMS49992_16700 [Clostridia bacterium]|nr:hypothetical protein AGMMS49992_16700 [Clostridia bacterium]